MFDPEPNGRFAHIAGPDGLKIELWEPKRRSVRPVIFRGSCGARWRWCCGCRARLRTREARSRPLLQPPSSSAAARSLVRVSRTGPGRVALGACGESVENGVWKRSRAAQLANAGRVGSDQCMLTRDQDLNPIVKDAVDQSMLAGDAAVTRYWAARGAAAQACRCQRTVQPLQPPASAEDAPASADVCGDTLRDRRAPAASGQAGVPISAQARGRSATPRHCHSC